MPDQPTPPGAVGEADFPARRIKLTPAASIAPEPVIWAWEPEPGIGRIPAGALTLAAGREGTGKSSFGIWLAARLSRGQLPGTFHHQPRTVFYAAVEDSWSRTLVPRLMAAGADLERVYRVDVDDVLQGETMLSLPLDTGPLEAAIAEHQVAALIIDPLMSTLGQNTDAHRTQDVRRALEPVVRMAERTTALTLGIAHFNKTTGTDASQLISGSGAFKDLARAILAFAHDRESGEQVMTQTKNSLGKLDLPSLSYRIEGCDIPAAGGTANVGRLDFTGIAERSVEDTLSTTADPEGAGERDEAATWLTDYLTEQGGEAPAGDIIKAAEKDGFAKRTLQRARSKVGVTSQKSGFGKGWVWVLNVTTPTEGDTKVPKVPTPRSLAPSAPSLSPSPNPTPSVTTTAGHCATCGDPMTAIEPDQTTHPGCTPSIF
ncbi:AAA family ATPase [Streptomyces sp. NBRC 109706]|uniref:AAA family ATPase n=1 Tax=Streptomyces sp. NBRC 109706 TaxID=1550035 RepID=UPI000781A09F|nr:AAA family ATPase [Streptomyces sp. NBRC 109706]